jgi:Protein of unknown function (DUF2786)
MLEINSAVLKKIAKLLAMQEAKGATEAEALIAAGHVQRLLEQYNLTLADVEQHGGVDEGKQRTKDSSLRASLYQPWRVMLMEGIASNSFCLAKGQLVKEGKKRVQRLLVIGREINVSSAKLTYNYLSTSLLRIMKEQGFKVTDSTGYAKEGNYFMEGATRRVIDRLNEQRRMREAESAKVASQMPTSSNALVLSDVYGSEADQNNDMLNNFPIGTTAARRRAQADLKAKQDAKYAELIKVGIDSDIAWYQSLGYSVEQANLHATNWKKQQNRQSKQSRRGYGSASHDWSRRDEAESKKVNSKAFKAGIEVGKKIGLDPQVEVVQHKMIGGK